MGPYIVQSHNGFSYYVIFVDHYTKYVWLFPIKHKSYVFHVFINFKKVIEKFFQTSILSFYYDNEKEFSKLKIYFAKNGISHFLRTPILQNKMAILKDVIDK